MLLKVCAQIRLFESVDAEDMVLPTCYSDEEREKTYEAVSDGNG